MPYSGRVLITPPGGGAAPASIDVAEETLVISPEGGQTAVLPYVDIDDVHDDNYTLRLTDFTGRRYDVSMLGKAYGQVLAEIRKRRNDLLAHNLLLSGVNLQDTFPAKLLGGSDPVPVEVRLFEDMLVIVPERGTMSGVPYSYVKEVKFEPDRYMTRVLDENGAQYTFAQMGKRSEEFAQELRRLLEAVAARTAKNLSMLLPGVSPAALSGLAALMRDGRAVQQRAVDPIDPSLWRRLEQVVVATPNLRQTYETLKGKCPPGWAAIGIKAVLSETGRMTMAEQMRRELQSVAAPESPPDSDEEESPTQDGEGSAASPGSLEAVTAEKEGAPPPPGEEGRDITVLWYFTPLARDGQPVNAMAQEITSEGGHATYVFRLMDPDRFASLQGDALADAVTESIGKINRALLTLNFRREPIYLPEEQLAAAKWGTYVVALRHLAYLRWTRQAFLGRAIHNTTWEQQLMEAASRV